MTVERPTNARFRGEDPEIRLEKLLENIDEVSPEYGVILRKYVQYLRNTGKGKTLTIFNDVDIMWVLLRITPEPIHDWTIDTLYSVADAIRGVSTGELEAKSYGVLTRSRRMIQLKRFVVWAVKKGVAPGISLEDAISISTPVPPPSKITEDDVISKETVHKYINNASTLRDQALISLVYYGALRISEAGNMLWGDIEDKGDHLIVRTTGKTGYEREVPIYEGMKYIRRWKEETPGPTENDSFVFITLRKRKDGMSHRPMAYATMLLALRKAVESAGDDPKEFHPHLLRHSRITHMMTEGVPEWAIKKIAWGTVKTNMIEVYAHPSQEDIAEAVKSGSKGINETQ